MTDRASPIRWYVDGTDLVGRQKDSPDERRPIADLPKALLIEGYAYMRAKNVSHEDIIAGKLPDRSLPTGGAGRVTEDSKWRAAIAHAVAEEDTGKSGLVGVPREVKEAAIADGMRYADTLTKQDVRDHQTRASVLAWYGRLHGTKDRIRPAAPALPIAAE